VASRASQRSRSFSAASWAACRQAFSVSRLPTGLKFIKRACALAFTGAKEKKVKGKKKRSVIKILSLEYL